MSEQEKSLRIQLQKPELPTSKILVHWPFSFLFLISVVVPTEQTVTEHNILSFFICYCFVGFGFFFLNYSLLYRILTISFFYPFSLI